MGRILECFDEQALLRLFDEAGVLDTLARKGYRDPRLEIGSPETGLVHTRLSACKEKRVFTLLDAVIMETAVSPQLFCERGYRMPRSLSLALVYWFREEDPTSVFTTGRAALPLQAHPGLGILRPVFRVLARMAHQTGKDGVGCIPKFFHDAVIFYRSRLFLFLDGCEQGRFERLLADIGELPLGRASVALAAGAVRDANGRLMRWEPGFQVFPLSPLLTEYFHSDWYAGECRRGLAGGDWRLDRAALDAALQSLLPAAGECR